MPAAPATHLLWLGLVLGAVPAPVLAQERPSEASQVPSQDEVQARPPESPSQEPTWIPIANSQWWVDGASTPRPGLFSSMDVTCTACGGTSTLERFVLPANRNAPWALQGTVRRATRLGLISTGLLGVRNYAAPVYTAMPIGGSFNAGPGSTVTANLAIPDTQWHLTAGFERTLMRTKRGVTFGLTGDVVLPVNAHSASANPLRIDPLSSLAVRFGLVVRW